MATDAESCQAFAKNLKKAIAFASTCKYLAIVLLLQAPANILQLYILTDTDLDKLFLKPCCRCSHLALGRSYTYPWNMMFYPKPSACNYAQHGDEDHSKTSIQSWTCRSRETRAVVLEVLTDDEEGPPGSARCAEKIKMLLISLNASQCWCHLLRCCWSYCCGIGNNKLHELLFASLWELS